MSTARDFYQGILTLIDQQVRQHVASRFKVASTSNGKVTLKTIEDGTALGEQYARIAGLQLNPDDEVLVAPLSGKPVVVGKIQRSEPTLHTFDTPLEVVADDANPALAVRGDGSVFKVVTSDGLEKVELANGAVLNGWSGEYGLSNWTWTINSADGSAGFDGDISTLGNITGQAITGASFNSPVVVVADTTSAFSTTSTSFTDLLSRNVTLGTGTWRVSVVGSALFLNTSGLRAHLRIDIDGGLSGLHLTNFLDNAVYERYSMAYTRTNVSGGRTITCKVMGACHSSGTTSMANANIIIVAQRTS